jgi:hypothetical protein
MSRSNWALENQSGKEICKNQQQQKSTCNSLITHSLENVITWTRLIFWLFEPPKIWSQKGTELQIFSKSDRMFEEQSRLKLQVKEYELF